MTAAAAPAWPLPMRAALAAALAFVALALLCEALVPVPPAHAPIRSADTGAMALLAPLVWAIELLVMLVVSLPAAGVGALLGRLASANMRLPMLAALGLPCGLLLGALYAQLAGPGSALDSTAVAMACGIGATAAALLPIGLHRAPPKGRR
jgi:hypothetical protein